MRSGGGYLDRVGFWLNELSTSPTITPIELQINKFLGKTDKDVFLKQKLLMVKTFNELAVLMNENGFDLRPVDLLAYQAQKILGLSRNNAETTANH